MAFVAHWDEAERARGEEGHLASWWTDLGEAAGSVTVGVQRIETDPGKWSTPAHVECAEEEIFYVLGGSGLLWLNAQTHEIGAGDCLVFLAEQDLHTLNAGAEGLDVLAFGTRRHAGGTYLPRAGVIRTGPGSAVAQPEDRHPWELEAEAGPPDLPAASPRPGRVVATEEVAPVERTNGGDVCRRQRDLASAAGSILTGLQHVTVPAGKLSCPPHCHSAEEELFVVLDGDGAILLGDEEHPLRRGSVVARPAATRVAHAFRAGDGGLTYLAYGTREPNDIGYYPRSGKMYFRGVGVIARLDSLDYWDGEQGDP
jgi:uncharacterized cupin superfamily protein